MKKQQVKAIIWGLAVLALGVILGGKALKLFEFEIFFKGWWTLFLIIPGLIGLFTDKHKFGNLFVIALGVIMLLASQEVFEWKVAGVLMGASVLVLAGLSMVFRSVFPSKDAKKIEEEVKKNRKNGKVESQSAFFSGNDRVYNKEEFEGSDIVAVFGGATLDLTNAVIKKDVVIKAFALFGGIEITVPDDICVKSNSGFIFGGISDDRKAIPDKGKHMLYLDAAGGFGGVSLKDSKTKKD